MSGMVIFYGAMLLVAVGWFLALLWVISMREAFREDKPQSTPRLGSYIICGKGYTADKHPEIAQSFVPVPGRLYVNRNGYVYKCLRLNADGDPVLMHMDTGWLLTATGCRVYHDGQIDWLSSYDCRFMEGAV